MMSKVAEIYLIEGKQLMLKLINIKNNTGKMVNYLIDDNEFQIFNGRSFYDMLSDDTLEDGTPILSELDKVISKVEKSVVTEVDKKIYSSMYFFCMTHRSYFDEVETVYNTLNGYHSGWLSFELTKSRLEEAYNNIVNSRHAELLTKCEIEVSNN
jgi:hypothetical protein